MSDSDIGCTSFSHRPPTDEKITLYTCVFRHEFETTNKNNGTVPEHWSIFPTNRKSSYVYWDEDGEHKQKYSYYGYECNEHETAFGQYDEYDGGHMTVLQDKCTGHKLKASDYRELVMEHVKIGKTVTPDLYNLMITALKFQIEERFKSDKFKTVYSKIHGYTTKDIYINSVNTAPKLSTKNISYLNELKNLMDAVKKLQPNRNYNNDEYFPCYDTKKEQIPSIDTLDDNGNYPTSTTPTSYNPKTVWLPKVSKRNMDAVMQTIKNDLNDCVCYSDCNSYSVCWCYGNCNHY